MKVSLLTQEFSPVGRCLKTFERKLNYAKYRLKGDEYKAWTCSFPVGGHQDVVDSFLKGARSFPGVEILVNPSRTTVKDTYVFVPSGWRALRDAIELRRRGEIKKLLAGPTVSDLPHMHDYLVADPAVDVCLVASPWVKDMFDAELRQYGRNANVQVWAAGVDHRYWAPQEPAPHAGFPNALVYVKHSGVSQLAAVLEVLATAKKSVKVLHNGSYVPEEYRSALAWSDFVVVLGESETQGLAIAQAWSMNRQTLVYDSPVISKYHRAMSAAQGVRVSAAPYLTEETGIFWKDAPALAELIVNMRALEPRAWLERNQTNERAFETLLGYL